MFINGNRQVIIKHNKKNSNDLITVDTTNLDFTINHNFSNQFHPEFKIQVKNNINSTIVIRIKTTKKDNYNVIPTYALIEPNQKLDVNFSFHLTVK